MEPRRGFWFIAVVALSPETLSSGHRKGIRVVPRWRVVSALRDKRSSKPAALALLVSQCDAGWALRFWRA